MPVRRGVPGGTSSGRLEALIAPGRDLPEEAVPAADVERADPPPAADPLHPAHDVALAGAPPPVTAVEIGVQVRVARFHRRHGGLCQGVSWRAWRRRATARENGSLRSALPSLAEPRQRLAQMEHGLGSPSELAASEVLDGFLAPVGHGGSRIRDSTPAAGSRSLAAGLNSISASQVASMRFLLARSAPCADDDREQAR